MGVGAGAGAVAVAVAVAVGGRDGGEWWADGSEGWFAVEGEAFAGEVGGGCEGGCGGRGRPERRTGGFAL